MPRAPAGAPLTSLHGCSLPQLRVGIRLPTPVPWNPETPQLSSQLGLLQLCPLCPLVAPKPPSSSSRCSSLPPVSSAAFPRLMYRASVSSDTLRAPPPADPSSQILFLSQEPDLAHLSPFLISGLELAGELPRGCRCGKSLCRGVLETWAQPASRLHCCTGVPATFFEYRTSLGPLLLSVRLV